MRFALNYSPEAVKLQQENRIQFDLMKLPPWPELVAQVQADYPVYIHYEFFAGTHPTDTMDFATVEHYLNTTDTALVNTHLGIFAADMPEINNRDLSPAVVEAVTARMIEGVAALVAEFGAEKVIGENLFSLNHDSPILLACTLPGVIRTVIEETGCGLLLDTAHAKMAAFTHGMPLQPYLETLPVDRIQEVHVTGIGFRDGYLHDHLLMRDDDWQAYEWVMERIHHSADWGTPDVVACEYGGVGPMFRPYSDKDVIAAQIPRMYQAVYPTPQPTH